MSGAERKVPEREEEPLVLEEVPVEAPPPGKSGWVGAIQIVAITAFVAVAFGFARDGSATPPVAQDAVAAPVADAPVSAIPVTTMQPVRQANRFTLSATGTVAVRNSISLAAEVSGRVVEISPNLRAGGTFSAGETLLRIDPSEAELAVAQASADVRVAESRLRLQLAEAEAATVNYGLIHPGKDVPPLVAKAPQIERSRAEVAAAEARLRIAELALARTVVSLPFGGTVIDSTGEVGQVVRENQGFGRVFAEDALEIGVPISETDLAQLQPIVGRAATVRGTDNVARAARVARVSAELDERTRFARLFLVFEDQASLLQPGAFVSVDLLGDAVEDSFVLPASITQTNGRIWIARGGQLEAVTPERLGRLGDGFLVRSFDVGDGVVVGSVPGAREGLNVVVSEGA